MVFYEREPASVTLDIEYTRDVVHGHQQLSLFNAITTNAVSFRSIFTTPKRSRPSPSSCGPARRRPASRCALNYASWRLIKIAARVVEPATRVRLAFAAARPEADLFRSLPGALSPLGS